MAPDVISHVSHSRVCCYFCKGSHTIYNCKKFLQPSGNDRGVQVSEKKVSFVCLRPRRFGHSCVGFCKHCKRKNNTLLHINTENTPSPANNPLESFFISCSMNNEVSGQFLLSTALESYFDCNNKPICCRVLLDSGNQSYVITSRHCFKLVIEKTPIFLDT